MPFGIMNAPSKFRSLMNEIFLPMLRRTMLAFFDDILVYISSWEVHMIHLRDVLEIL